MRDSRRNFLKLGLAAAAAAPAIRSSLAAEFSANRGAGSGKPAAEPKLIETADQLQSLARLPNGQLMGWWIEGGATGQEAIYSPNIIQKTRARYSSDDGWTWSDAQTLFECPKGFGSYSAGPSLTDQNGLIHLFGLYYLGCGPGGDDNWKSCKGLAFNVMSTDGGKTWTPVRYCDFGHGYTGSTNSAIQLKSGRILLPVSYLSGRMTGRNICNLSISDDGGKTWRPSKGKCVVDTGGHLAESGAIEPASVELGDGRVWMLIRTQAGRQYEAFSTDGGDTWTEPVPSRFVSSNAPGALLRLRDGRIVFVWNNCMGPEHREGIISSYDRQVLAAAISADDGKTWQGYREIGRIDIDKGEWQISYPFIIEAKDGSIICSGLAGTGYFPQGLIRVQPDWLTETQFQETFEQGMAHWVTFGCEGAKIERHPDHPGSKVLAFRKPKADVPAAASLNFPFGKRGHIQLRIQLEPSREFKRQHYYLCLTDFFCLPRLPYHGANRAGGWGDFPAGGCFTLRIAPDGRLGVASGQGLFQTDFKPTATSLRNGRWYTLVLDWDCAKQTCSMKVDGRHVAELPQLSPAHGICYLRIWAAVSIPDYSGVLLESVNGRVEP